MNLPSSDTHAARRGVIAVAIAFGIWGLLPLYLKPLHLQSAIEIAAWRSVLGGLTVLAWLWWQGEAHDVWRVLKQPALALRLSITSALLAINWTFYAWGVAHGQVLITSLGYFINPLVNVLFGVWLLHEQLRTAQKVAVGIATLAVLGLTLHAGQLPWLALLLAVSFSLYGLLRKTTSVMPLTGLACESMLIAPLALGALWWSWQHEAQFWPDSYLGQGLILFSGVVTMLPLALFNFGAQRINYATVGMLQYIGPTLQFFIGCFIYHEPLSTEKLLCFIGIWLALAVYAGDSIYLQRRGK